MTVLQRVFVMQNWAIWQLISHHPKLCCGVSPERRYWQLRTCTWLPRLGWSGPSLIFLIVPEHTALLLPSEVRWASWVVVDSVLGIPFVILCAGLGEKAMPGRWQGVLLLWHSLGALWSWLCSCVSDFGCDV